MKRNCDSCTLKNTCKKFQVLDEQCRSQMSCDEYQPMDIEEYIMWQKNKHSSFMISTKGCEKYFKNQEL